MIAYKEKLFTCWYKALLSIMNSNFLILKSIRLPYVLYPTQLHSCSAQYDPQVHIWKAWVLSDWALWSWLRAQESAYGYQTGSPHQRPAPTSVQHPPLLTGAAKASCTPEPPPPLPGEGQTPSAFDHPLGAGRQHTDLQLSLMWWM